MTYRNYARTLWFTIGVALALSGCGLFGGYSSVDIDTTRKAAVVANAEVRGGYLLLESLVENRAITSEAARRAQGHLDTANESIKATFRAVQAGGDPTQAEDSLSAANTALDLALALLGEFAAQP
jgi:hypothetical protein